MTLMGELQYNPTLTSRDVVDTYLYNATSMTCDIKSHDIHCRDGTQPHQGCPPRHPQFYQWIFKKSFNYPGLLFTKLLTFLRVPAEE